MDFVLQTTPELSERQQKQFSDLFEEVYGKRLGVDGFRAKYMRWASCGYGYHALMYDGDSLVAAFNGLPVRYNVAGREMTLAVGADSMTRKGARGNLLYYKRLNEMVYDALARDDIPVIYGYPNPISWPLLTKFMGWRDMGCLNYYIRPTNLSGYHALGGVATPLCRIIGSLADAIAQKASNSEPVFSVGYLRGGEYPQRRFCMGQTLVREGDGAYYAYDILELEGQRMCCLIDVFPLTRRRFDETVHKLSQTVGSTVRGIVYIGRLPFRPWSLIKVPRRYEPRHFYMACRLTGEDRPDLAPLFDINNWNVGLTDVDLI